MKCPKCGYQSFNNLTACKKCGRDLTRERAKFNLGHPIVIPPPAQSPAPSSAASTLPAPPAAPPAPEKVLQEPTLQADETGLEDYFLSIDDLDYDHIPSIDPPGKQEDPKTGSGTGERPEAPLDFSRWSRETPEGDFPFDEINTDLKALRLSTEETPAADGETPFDDVDSFDIDWQLPLNEEALPNQEAKTISDAPPIMAEPGAAAGAHQAAAPLQGPGETEAGPIITSTADDIPLDWANIDPDLSSATDAAESTTPPRLLFRRAQAFFLDLGLLATFFLLFLAAGEVIRVPVAEARFRFTGDVLLDLAAPYFLVFFALCFGYFTLFHYLRGQTPGKMLFNLQVESNDHSELSLSQAFLRCAGGLISLLPFGLGVLSIPLDAEQRGWNDRLAGSRVVLLEDSQED